MNELRQERLVKISVDSLQKLIDAALEGYEATTPSMRRPVGVKYVLSFFFVGQSFFTESPLSPHFHPQSVMSIVLAASWVFSFQPVLPPVWRPVFLFAEKLGQALDAVTGTRRFWLCLSFLSQKVFLSGCRRCQSAAVV